VVLTVPVGVRRRVTVGLSRRGVAVVPWRETGVLPVGWDDDAPGTGGVREPRRPVAPREGGAVALPLD